MNFIALVEAEHKGRRYWDIQVDGKSLGEYFVGHHGVHPSQISPLCWATADDLTNQRTTEQFLLRAKSELASGRVPVLVCEECGGVACGAYAVRISRNGSIVTWTDWTWENGDGCPRPVDDWAERPPPFQFLWKEYEQALSRLLPSV